MVKEETSTKEDDFKAPILMKVRALEDIARFVASAAAMGQPIYLLSFPLGEKQVFGLLAVYHDYYDYYGVPLFYYHVNETKIEGKYLLIKTEETRETVSVGDGVKPGWIAVPIIHLEKQPPFLDELKK
jgi:hypothetical protein